MFEVCRRWRSAISSLAITSGWSRVAAGRTTTSAASSRSMRPLKSGRRSAPGRNWRRHRHDLRGDEDRFEHFDRLLALGDAGQVGADGPPSPPNRWHSMQPVSRKAVLPADAERPSPSVASASASSSICQARTNGRSASGWRSSGGPAPWPEHRRGGSPGAASGPARARSSGGRSRSDPARRARRAWRWRCRTCRVAAGPR